MSSMPFICVPFYVIVSRSLICHVPRPSALHIAVLTIQANLAQRLQYMASSYPDGRVAI